METLKEFYESFEEEDSLLKGVKIFKFKRFKDHRGYYDEIFNKKLYEKYGCPEFIQDDISVSKKDVFRGIHGDSETWKLVSCLFGKFILFIVNNDKNSDQYLGNVMYSLSAEIPLQVLIPPKFGNGHLVLSDVAIFHYKQSTYYKGMKNQFTLRVDDPKIDFLSRPKIDELIMSERDRNASFIA